MTRKSIFDAVKAALKRPFAPKDVVTLDGALDAMGVPREQSARRRIGSKGLALIKRYEGLQLRAYLCPAKVWTIGYGSTGAHVKPGMVITEAQAEALMMDDLARFEAAVAKAAPNATQDQFDAMVSLAFNVGIAAFNRSTVLRKHLAGDHVGAADAFGMWNKAGGRVLSGLVKRRHSEAEIYRGRA